MAHRNRRINVWLLLVGIAVLVGAGITGSLMRPALEPDQVVPARFGDVAWNHQLHARMKEIASCQVCHHQERPGTTQPRPCRQCHRPESNRDSVVLADLHMEIETPRYEGENGPPAMTAFHGRCVGCHRAMKAGPMICRDCHAQTFVGAHGTVRWNHLAHARRIDMPADAAAVNDCLYCHHQDREAETEADYRPCDACHKPAAVLELPVATGLKKHERLLHGDCERCHTVTNPEEDLRTCKDCHPSWQVDPAVVRPAIEQAIHARCQVCHQRDYAGLTEAMPVRCNDCHEPDPSVLADLEVGLILWNHDRHAGYGEGMACNVCHHTDKPDQPHMACDRCHGTGLYDNPRVADALRKRCIGCHQEKNNGLVAWEQLPTQREEVDWYEYLAPDGRSFWWDHRAHGVAWSFSCRNCHHGILQQDDRYATEVKAQIAWSGEATRVQSCRSCHGSDGPVAGSPAANTRAPSLHQAMERVCLECHRRLGGGPQEWEDYYRVERLPEEDPAATVRRLGGIR